MFAQEMVVWKILAVLEIRLWGHTTGPHWDEHHMVQLEQAKLIQSCSIGWEITVKGKQYVDKLLAIDIEDFEEFED